MYSTALEENCTNDFLTKGPVPLHRVVVGVTCFLSMLGALMIILIYICLKSLRNKPREILLHLSVMDFGIGCSNFIGVAVYFDRFYHNGSCVDGSAEFHNVSSRINNLCIAQAFFAHYCTLGSVLWTISLAVYIYLMILYRSQSRSQVYAENGHKDYSKHWLRGAYIACYGLPLINCLWLLFTNRLGYSPYTSTGWCSIIVINPLTREPDTFVTVIGYDLWIYLAMFLVPVMYIGVHFYLRNVLKDAQHLGMKADQFWKSVYILDYKFFLIPLAFTILRMWTCISSIIHIYVNAQGLPQWLDIALVYLTGIGDSGQGFANAIIFIICTKKVRVTVFSGLTKVYHLCCCCCCCSPKGKEETPLLRRKAGSLTTLPRYSSNLLHDDNSSKFSTTPEPSEW